jgi:hypothetical protein
VSDIVNPYIPIIVFSPYFLLPQWLSTPQDNENELASFVSVCQGSDGTKPLAENKMTGTRDLL